jgi:hypothetical protein
MKISEIIESLFISRFIEDLRNMKIVIIIMKKTDALGSINHVMNFRNP